MKYHLTWMLLLLLGTSQAQDLSELYKKVNAGVVTIQVVNEEMVGTGSVKKKASVAGMGSGFRIDERLVVTAAHVVQTSESITVVFMDGEKVPAKVLSIFKNADVALLELAFKPKVKTTLKFGDSDKMEIGQQIFVIGAPLGLEHSLSSGYISGKIGNMSKVSNAFTRLEFFQTDAAINQGNSGGPMFNLDGEVIGIVSYILSQSGGFEGLGFVATSNVAKDLLLDRNPFYMGVDGTVISGDMAKIFNLPQKSAFLVEKVVFLSTGGLMGLRGGKYTATIEGQTILLGGDVILAMEGIQFSEENLDKISDIFNSYKAGDQITVTVLREGKQVELKGEVK